MTAAPPQPPSCGTSARYEPMAAEEEQPPAKRLRPEAANQEERIGIDYFIVPSMLERRGARPDDCVAAKQRFTASLKTLFSDFIVREQSALVDDGRPLRLTSIQMPRDAAPRGSKGAAGPQEPPLADADILAIQEAFAPLIGAENTARLVALVTPKAEEEESATSITLPPIADKKVRSAVHQTVKALLGSRFVSEAMDGQIVIRRATQALLREQSRRNRSVALTPFLHFTMYKENLDSGAALRMVAQHLGIHAKTLLFSGTKDKRGVTTQRVACRGMDPAKLMRLNNSRFGRNAKLKVGNCELRPEGLSLGDLRGNFFEIVLRCCDEIAPPLDANADVAPVNASALKTAVDILSTNGFVNFFGPQRFGTTSVLTCDVGRALLRGAFREAVLLVLRSKVDVSPEVSDALHIMETEEGNASAALDRMPHYCFLERDILKHLVRSPGDYRGSFTCIPRTMAMLYYHSVQSLVWNRMASHRLRSQGPIPVVGDLVRSEIGVVADNTSGPAALDGDVEGDAVEAVGEDLAAETTGHLVAVRCLTEEDIAQNKFSIHDVLLTVPGTDPMLVFPTAPSANREQYNRVLKELDCLELLSDPFDCAKVYHFHGTYRQLVVRPEGLSADVRTVRSFREPVLRTDLECIYDGFRENRKGNATAHVQPQTAETEVSLSNDKEGAGNEDEIVEPTTPVVAPAACAPETKPHTVVVLTFGLPPGAYATSLIRELCVTVKE